MTRDRDQRVFRRNEISAIVRDAVVKREAELRTMFETERAEMEAQHFIETQALRRQIVEHRGHFRDWIRRWLIGETTP
jgi:hypothetical protein